jgi:hypothetical protein
MSQEDYGLMSSSTFQRSTLRVAPIFPRQLKRGKEWVGTWDPLLAPLVSQNTFTSKCIKDVPSVVRAN